MTSKSIWCYLTVKSLNPFIQLILGFLFSPPEDAAVSQISEAMQDGPEVGQVQNAIAMISFINVARAETSNCIGR